MLSIKDLRASIEGKEILKGITLEVNEGEVHAIMGPNGSGKSTLASLVAGKKLADVTGGSITYLGENLFDLNPEERSKAGIFLGFQYPIEIPGVTMVNFLKAALNEHRKHKGLEPLSAKDFLKLLREKKDLVEIDSKLTNRSVNAGFSGGGEKEK
ncbi:putative ATP-dependent transporter SufC [subsurface metagenome]